MLIIVKLFLRFAVATCISIQPNSRETRAIERAKTAGRRLGGERSAAEHARRRSVAAGVKNKGRRSQTDDQKRCVKWVKMWKKNHLAACKTMQASKSYKLNRATSNKAMQAKVSYQKASSSKSAAPLKNLIKSGVLKPSGKKTIKTCVYKYCFRSNQNKSTKEVALGLTKDGYWTVKGTEQYGYPQLLRSVGANKTNQVMATRKIMVKSAKNWVSLHSILYK
jgi:hypothetical protein